MPELRVRLQLAQLIAVQIRRLGISLAGAAHCLELERVVTGGQLQAAHLAVLGVHARLRLNVRRKCRPQQSTDAAQLEGRTLSSRSVAPMIPADAHDAPRPGWARSSSVTA